MASPVHDEYTKIELLVDPTSNSTCELEKNEELFLTQPEDQELEPLLAPTMPWQHSQAHEPIQRFPDHVGQLEVEHTQPQYATEILRIYTTLWESYITKKAECERLIKENDGLRTANSHLCQERAFLVRQHANQEALLVFIEQAVRSIQEGITEMATGWDTYSPK